WLNVILEPCGGRHHAELSNGVNDHHPTTHGSAENAGDKSTVLQVWSADANRLGVARTTKRADIDVVAPGGQIDASLMAYRDIIKASGVKQRINTNCCVEVARRVHKKCATTHGCVFRASNVASESTNTIGGV